MIERPFREGLFSQQRKELIALEATALRPAVLPDRLDPAEIGRAEALFQPRDTSLVMSAGHSAKHVKTLAKSAIDQADLDPVAIAAFGNRWFLLDGHHRLEAYVRAKRTGPVPVLVHDGKERGAARVAWAVGLSTQLNSKEKLPMSGRDKADAAWRMTVLGGRSKAQIKLSSGASTSSIGSMRRFYKALFASGKVSHNELQAMTWSQALWRHRTLNEDPGEDKFGDEDRKRRLLIKKLSPAFVAHVPMDRLLYALEELKPGITEEFSRVFRGSSTFEGLDDLDEVWLDI